MNKLIQITLKTDVCVYQYSIKKLLGPLSCNTFTSQATLILDLFGNNWLCYNAQIESSPKILPEFK